MQRPVFLVNSRLGRVTAAPSGFTRKVLHPTGAPLLPKLRGHFAEFLNEGFLDRLGILYPPTCVGFGTGGDIIAWIRAFLGGIATPTSPFGSHSCLVLMRVFATRTAQLAQAVRRPSARTWVGFAFPVLHPVNAYRYRNINLLCIDYALRPRLSSRLTLRRLALLRNP
jgi:hypothetical protein